MPELQMPKLSDTMTEGTLVSWKKKKGDKVSAGEVLAEIETDKATMEWESPEDGTLTEIYVEEGGKVNVGDRIAFIGEEGEAAPEKEPKPAEAKAAEKPQEKQTEAKAKEKKAQTETEKPAPAEKKEKETAPPQEKVGEKSVEAVSDRRPEVKSDVRRAPLQSDEARVKASPVARRVAAELGVDLGSVKGTGPDGRVTETDVRAAAKAGGAAGDRGHAAPERPTGPRLQQEGETHIQLSGMRRIIAQRLSESLGPVPHFYLTVEIDAGPLAAAREELKTAGEGADAAKITVNDFVLKAAVMAAVKVPKANASFAGDSVIQYADVDLGIAVAIEDGLLTPVIKGAQNKSLREISAIAKDLASRARNKRMKPEEFQGGNFTVSNLGGMGIDSFSAIINPPQGFILAVGKVNKVTVIDDSEQIVVGHRMKITMSCDHRVIDGALGAEYLKELRHLLENPALLLV